MNRDEIYIGKLVERNGTRYVVIREEITPYDDFFEIAQVQPNMLFIQSGGRCVEFTETELEKCDDCQEDDLVRLYDHPLTALDYKGFDVQQSYAVYYCRNCGDYWSCHHQWSQRTGFDDRWERWGPNPDVIVRHD